MEKHRLAFLQGIVDSVFRSFALAVPNGEDSITSVHHVLIAADGGTLKMGFVIRLVDFGWDAFFSGVPLREGIHATSTATDDESGCCRQHGDEQPDIDFATFAAANDCHFVRSRHGILNEFLAAKIHNADRMTAWGNGEKRESLKG